MSNKHFKAIEDTGLQFLLLTQLCLLRVEWVEVRGL